MEFEFQKPPTIREVIQTLEAIAAEEGDNLPVCLAVPSVNGAYEGSIVDFQWIYGPQRMNTPCVTLYVGTDDMKVFCNS